MALILFVEGKFAESVAIYERLGFTDNEYQLEGYRKLGRIEKLRAYHLGQLKKHPNHAWTMGKYAQFLLHTAGDVDGAIEYGKQAVALSPHRSAKLNLAVAYTIKAARVLRTGDAAQAQAYWKLAGALGFERSYLSRACRKYCFEVWESAHEFDEAGEVVGSR